MRVGKSEVADLHIHIHCDPITIRLDNDSVTRRLDAIQATLDHLERGQKTIMATLADIKAKVAAEKTVEDSAVALLQSISQQLKDAIANGDPAQLQQIADMLDSDTQALSEAVTANTPAA